jgi:hypothetical protein
MEIYTSNCHLLIEITRLTYLRAYARLPELIKLILSLYDIIQLSIISL